MTSTEVEFLEERLALLEAWLESTNDDDDNEDLIQKREEYRGLIEETILLQKKLRKTSKLLSTEKSEKMLQKLSKKQDQYVCEIEEIMEYAESDVLFETAEIEPNELLGEPLETLMEQPGMEGSCTSSLNFSMSDFMPAKALLPPPSEITTEIDESQPITENKGAQSLAKLMGKHNESSATISTDSTSLFTTSTGNSNTYNYDERTLRKKLKKVEKLLLAEESADFNFLASPLDATQIKKLRKKHAQYTDALQYVMNGRPSSPTKYDDGPEAFDPLYVSPRDVEEAQLQEDSYEVIEEEVEEKIEVSEMKEHEEFYHEHEQLHDSPANHKLDHNRPGSISYDRKTLKKKLKKLKRMMEASNDAKELELYKKKKKEYKMALQKMKEDDNENPSRSNRSQHEFLESQELPQIGGNNGYILPSHSGDSNSRHNSVPFEEENDDQIEVLKKKLRKADKAIAKARKEGDPKKLKKMEKKRLEYQSTLNELLSYRY
mmetsp:Transcript_13716/g.34491  ORF Transcript_13716/g.34491 Transcript_13716/m.34491 type:complete len:490 (-) Transcript_13716:189-1658(-)